MGAPRREGGPPTLAAALASLRCALRLRCPICQRGALFAGRFTLRMHRRCTVCGLTFDRGDGYFTGALAINLLLTEVVALAVWLPLALDPARPLGLVYAAGIGASVIAPILGFRHARSFWVALDRLINPVR